MKTVHDIFVEAIALEGLTPRQIADRVVDIGHDNGFMMIDEHGSGSEGQLITIELRFPDGEVIYFDGADWRYIP
jgi:hypothetical protein